MTDVWNTFWFSSTRKWFLDIDRNIYTDFLIPEIHFPISIIKLNLVTLENIEEICFPDIRKLIIFWQWKKHFSMYRKMLAIFRFQSINSLYENSILVYQKFFPPISEIIILSENKFLKSENELNIGNSRSRHDVSCWDPPYNYKTFRPPARWAHGLLWWPRTAINNVVQTSGKLLDLYRTGGPVTTWKIQVLLVLQNFYRTYFFSNSRIPIEGLPTAIFLPNRRTGTLRVFIGPPLFSPVEDRGPVDFLMSGCILFG